MTPRRCPSMISLRMISQTSQLDVVAEVAVTDAEAEVEATEDVVVVSETKSKEEDQDSAAVTEADVKDPVTISEPAKLPTQSRKTKTLLEEAGTSTMQVIR